MCFEHNLCAKLTSNDTTQTTGDDKQQELLLSIVQSTVGHDVKMPQKSESDLQEKLVKLKKSGDYTQFIYEPIVPAAQSLRADNTGKRPSIKRSPSLSKIEEEDNASNTSACSEEAGSSAPLKLSPVKLMPLQDFPYQLIQSPMLAAIEEESVKSSSVSSSPVSVPCSPTTVNRGIMQSLMDQKIEHASKDDDENDTPLDIDVNSDLGSVSLDPAIWSDSEAEQITITEESPQPSKQQEEIDITPAMKAVGSVRNQIINY